MSSPYEISVKESIIFIRQSHKQEVNTRLCFDIPNKFDFSGYIVMGIRQNRLERQILLTSDL